MDLELTGLEARVLGSLIEKQITTPDYYPMTLNALTAACNQKQNRHPVMDLADTDVVRALNRLKDLRLTVTTIQTGSRVPKYRHILPERVELTPAELAIVCELLLRGPQTVGELKGRAGRMHAFHDLDSVQQRLDRLVEGGVLVQLPRQPGRKENRYMHLLCGEPDLEALPAPEPRPEAAALRVQAEDARLADLEAEVTALRRDLDALKQAFAAFRREFE